MNRNGVYGNSARMPPPNNKWSVAIFSLIKKDQNGDGIIGLLPLSCSPSYALLDNLKSCQQRVDSLTIARGNASKTSQNRHK